MQFTREEGDVVIPELVDSLEWVLDCPPNVHQFEEPPVSTVHNSYLLLKGKNPNYSFYLYDIDRG